jgi:hypothetical protein
MLIKILGKTWNNLGNQIVKNYSTYNILLLNLILIGVMMIVNEESSKHRWRFFPSASLRTCNANSITLHVWYFVACYIVAFLTPRLQDTKTHKGKTLKLGVSLCLGDEKSLPAVPEILRCRSNGEGTIDPSQAQDKLRMTIHKQVIESKL